MTEFRTFKPAAPGRFSMQCDEYLASRLGDDLLLRGAGMSYDRGTGALEITDTNPGTYNPDGGDIGRGTGLRRPRYEFNPEGGILGSRPAPDLWVFEFNHSEKTANDFALAAKAHGHELYGAKYQDPPIFPLYGASGGISAAWLVIAEMDRPRPASGYDPGVAPERVVVKNGAGLDGELAEHGYRRTGVIGIPLNGQVYLGKADRGGYRTIYQGRLKALPREGHYSNDWEFLELLPQEPAP